MFFAILVTLGTAPAGDAWPQFGGPTGDFRAAGTKSGKDAVEWKRAFGTGTSGVVTDGTRFYTTYAVPAAGGKAGDEFAAALDPATGKTIWEKAVPVKLLAKQEAFGGGTMRPQATPAVADGRVFTVGFTGLLHARDAATGDVLWATDLVADHAATPVQFGFAASPVVYAGKLLVGVGGKHAVIAFDPKTGAVLWKTAAAEPAYATPVVTTANDRTMIMQLTRDALFGFDPADGTTLWTYPLPEKRLTNVPTPLALPGGGIIISCQGVNGTRRLRLEPAGAGFAVKEVWIQRKAQFFYTNWCTDGDAVYGFSGNGGKRFTGLRVSDGTVIFQDIGQTDANVVLVNRDLLLCRGDGLLSRGTATADGFAAAARGKPVAGRCWTPPTVVGDAVVVRSDAELAVVRLSSLAADFKAPADAGVSALDAAYAPRPKPKPPDK